MLCEKYQQLTVEERIRLIGSVVHCIQNDDTFFELSVKAIDRAVGKGVMDGVTILPAPLPQEPNY